MELGGSCCPRVSSPEAGVTKHLGIASDAGALPTQDSLPCPQLLHTGPASGANQQQGQRAAEQQPGMASVGRSSASSPPQPGAVRPRPTRWGLKWHGPQSSCDHSPTAVRLPTGTHQPCVSRRAVQLRLLAHCASDLGPGPGRNPAAAIGASRPTLTLRAQPSSSDQTSNKRLEAAWVPEPFLPPLERHVPGGEAPATPSIQRAHTLGEARAPKPGWLIVRTLPATCSSSTPAVPSVPLPSPFPSPRSSSAKSKQGPPMGTRASLESLFAVLFPVSRLC